MRLYFVRHGETDWNKARKIQGQVDIPLNAFGRHLAEATRDGLSDISFDICYSSPMSRAVETAECILEGRDVPVIKDDRIVEMAFGEWEGRCCSKEGWDLPESFRLYFSDPEHFEPAEGGETFADVKKRTGEFLSELYQKEEYKDFNILVTTHGAALGGLLNNIKNLPLSQYWGTGVHKNCGVTEVEVTNGVPHILSEDVVYYTDEIESWYVE